MGLDMYLIKKTYVKNWDHSENKTQVNVKFNNKQHPHIQPKRITEIAEEVGYWRKANHIHNWFVQNVQGGVDECEESYVCKDDLNKLLEDCKSVLKDKDLSKAEKILPTIKGFFFGGDDYDEYYIKDTEDTIKIIEELLNEKDEKGCYAGEIYYKSSW